MNDSPIQVTKMIRLNIFLYFSVLSHEAPFVFTMDFCDFKEVFYHKSGMPDRLIFFFLDCSTGSMSLFLANIF